MNIKLLPAAAILFCIVFQVRAQSPASALDQLYRQITNDPRTHLNGVVLVAEHGKIIYSRASGYSNRDAKIPNSDSTAFQLASLSKVFTAIAVMQLVEKGKISIDDPLIKYFPDFPYPAIKIRHLLSHTSGLPDFSEVFGPENTPDHPLTNADLISVLRSAHRELGAPGTSWHYSSVGYGLLAMLVAKVSAISFADYLKEFIFLPAGMDHSYILTAYDLHTDRLRAIAYTGPGPGDSIRTDFKDPWQTIYGPGLVVSTARDLLRFDQALYANKMLSAAIQKQMYTPATLLSGEMAQLDHAPIFAGLGWGIDIDHSSGVIVSHNGGSPGISTMLLRNLDKGQAVIVLENTGNMATIDFGVNAMNILNHRSLMHFGPGPGN